MATEKALVFVIRANISDFNKKLGDAERSFKKTFGNISNELQNISKISLGIGAAIVAPLALAFKDSTQYAHDIEILSEKIGFNIEETQRWSNMMTLAGGSGDDLTTMVKKMSAAYDAAVTGTVKASQATDGLSEDLDNVVIGSDKASKAFNQLGINLSDFGKLDTEGRLRAIFVALSKITDTNVQQTIVGALLGKGGQKALAAAKGDVEAFLASMSVMSTKTVEELAKGREAIERMEIAWRNLVGAFVAATFGGDATKGIETLTEKLNEFSKWVTEHPDDAKAITNIAIAVAGLAIAIGTLAGVAFTIVQVAGAFTILSTAATVIGAALTAGGWSGAIAIVLGLIGGALEAAGAAIAAAVAGLLAGVSLVTVGWIVLIVAAVVAAIWLIVANWDTIAKFFTNLWASISAGFAQLWPQVVAGFTQAKDWVIAQWNAVVTWFQGLPAAIQAAMASVWTWLTQPFVDAWAEIQRVADQIKTAWDNLFNGGGTITVTASGKNIATATGGIFNSPTLRLIGEAGPEAVIPLGRLASVTPQGGNTTVNISAGAFMGSREDARSFARMIQEVMRNENNTRTYGRLV